jgi:hypothetical protein
LAPPLGFIGFGSPPQLLDVKSTAPLLSPLLFGLRLPTGDDWFLRAATVRERIPKRCLPTQPSQQLAKAPA